MAPVERRKLEACKLAGRSIWQDEKRKRTVYSNILMKDYGYIINDENAAEYYNYSLRTIESLFGAAVVTVLTSKLLLGLGFGLLLHAILSYLFYFHFLRKLPKTERFERYKKDNYVVSMAKDMSVVRLLLVVLLLSITSYIVIYAAYNRDYSAPVQNLLIALHILVSAFDLLNVYTLFYKLIKRI